MMFVAQTTAKLNETDENNSIIIHEYEELETNNGWKYPKDLTKTDLIVSEDSGLVAIKHLSFDSVSKLYKLEF